MAGPLSSSEFDPEYEALAHEVQDELLAHLKVLEEMGPQLGRPRVDTLKGSEHANMKELRFDAGTAFGALHSRSIPNVARSSYAVEISREEARRSSTGILLRGLTRGSTGT